VLLLKCSDVDLLFIYLSDSNIRAKRMLTVIQKIQDAQLSQRDRAAACVIVFDKSRSLKLGDNILRTL